ncbi:facilitated trehalose transporter Tret1-like isoform X1 [Diabrotica virgifera virgifera]|nr:facilitated trehalose transporter Tret1-like isoform X1 [Diabrotica virgifera virgifera]
MKISGHAINQYLGLLSCFQQKSKKVIDQESESAFYQYLSCFFAMLSMMSSGFHYGWPSPTLPKLLAKDSSIHITEDEGFWLATMPLFGAFIGSFTNPILVDRIGRHKTILLTSGPYLVSWVLIYLATNIPTIYGARFIAGISDGWSYSIPIYTGEISDPTKRGMFGAWTSISFIFGILTANVVGSYLSIEHTALVGGSIPILLVLTFMWMPESPYYYIIKGNLAGARKSLKILRGSKNVDEELNRINEAVKADMNKTSINPLHLFTVKRNRRALLIMTLCRGAQQLSGNTAISFYAQNIFSSADSFVPPEIASNLYFLIQLIVTIIASNIVDRVGRRPLLLISVAGAGIALLVEGVYFYVKTSVDVTNFTMVPIVALIVYVVFFSLGLQGIPVIILSEVFNADVKAIALGFSDVYFSVTATATSKYFQATRDAYGMFVPFVTFSAICAISFILMFFLVPETKGKTLEEIQEYFKSGRDGKTTNESSST